MDENDDFSLSTFGERRINKSPPLMESSDLSVRHRVTVSLRIFSPHPIEMPARPRIPAMPGMSDIRDDQGLLRGYDVIVPPTEKTFAKKTKILLPSVDGISQTRKDDQQVTELGTEFSFVTIEKRP